MMKKQSEIERLRAVVNLIPEYVDALVEEWAGAELMAAGMDGRSVHGPALRKSDKIEARIAGILGNSKRSEVRGQSSDTGKGERLTGSKVRKLFFQGLEAG